MGGPINGDPAPGRSPGPPAGISVVEGIHGDIIENTPTLLLTKDPKEYDERDIVTNSSNKNNLLYNLAPKSDNYRMQKTKDSDTLSVSSPSITKPKSEVQCSERSSSYLRPRDKIIRVEMDQTMKYTESSSAKPNVQSPPLRFDVTHDVFDTSHGIVRGLLYTGENIFTNGIHTYLLIFFSRINIKRTFALYLLI